MCVVSLNILIGFTCCEMLFFNDRTILHPIRASRGRKKLILKINSKWIARSVSIIYWNKRKFLHILWQIRAQNHQTKSNQWVDRRKTKMSPMLESKLFIFPFELFELYFLWELNKSWFAVGLYVVISDVSPCLCYCYVVLHIHARYWVRITTLYWAYTPTLNPWFDE